MANVTCTNATAPPALNYCWSSPTNTMGTNMQTITFTPLTPGIYQATGTVAGVSHFMNNNVTNDVPFAGTGTNSFMVLKAELDEVTFGGGTTNFFSIFRDGGNAIDAGSQELYTQSSPAHWKRGRTRSGMPEPSYPIAYMRNGKMKASAKITITPSSFSGDLKIFGRGQFTNFMGETFSFLFPTNTVHAFGGVAIYPMTEVPNIPPNSHTGELPNKIDLINLFKLDWKVSCGSSTNFMNAGTSTNQLYVTLHAPKPALVKLFHTIVHLACAKPGASNPMNAVSNSWLQLAGPANFTTWDKRTLYYYKPGLRFGLVCQTTAQLLKDPNGNGQCSAWASLFQDALFANGIQSQLVNVDPVDPIVDKVFLVKDWMYGSRDAHLLTNVTPPYSWILQTARRSGPGQDRTLPEMVPIPPGGVYSNLTSLATVPGQNTGPPAEKIFRRHVIVQHEILFYDPSYGLTYPGPSLVKGAHAFEAQAVEGYATQVPKDNPALASSNLISRVRKPVGPGGAPLHGIKFSH